MHVWRNQFLMDGHGIFHLDATSWHIFSSFTKIADICLTVIQNHGKFLKRKYPCSGLYSHGNGSETETESCPSKNVSCNPEGMSALYVSSSRYIVGFKDVHLDIKDWLLAPRCCHTSWRSWTNTFIRFSNNCEIQKVRILLLLYSWVAVFLSHWSSHLIGLYSSLGLYLRPY